MTVCEQAKSIADPFAYETYRQQRIQEKIESERAARITVRKLRKAGLTDFSELLSGALDSCYGLDVT